MASKQHKKKFNKRFGAKHNTTMNSRFSYRKISILVPVVFVFASLLILAIFLNIWKAPVSSNQAPQIYTAEIVKEFPHDRNAFTQGLLYAENDTLFESTGLHGKSSVRQVSLQTGKVEILQKMDYSYFGEGLTLLGKRLFQVTWLTNTGFIYDRYNLSKFKTFTHQMRDGWGLATDGNVLYGSDGSSTLYQIDPQTLKVTEKHIVKYNGHEVSQLNELEYINGEVWANIWQTDCIARISHKDGAVLGWILLPNLRSFRLLSLFNKEKLMRDRNHNIDVLNGIAWDSRNKRIFVTGKLWPKLYEIKLHPVKQQFKAADIEKLCVR